MLCIIIGNKYTVDFGIVPPLLDMEDGEGVSGRMNDEAVWGFPTFPHLETPPNVIQHSVLLSLDQNSTMTRRN